VAPLRRTADDCLARGRTRACVCDDDRYDDDKDDDHVDLATTPLTSKSCQSSSIKDGLTAARNSNAETITP
jgi:hypothetical protein